MDLFSDLPEPEKEIVASAREEEKGTNESSTSVDAKADSRPQQQVPEAPKSTFSEKKVTSQQEEKEDKVEPSAQKRKASGDVGDGVPAKRLASGLYRLYGCFAERKGERNEMQDAHVVLDDFTDQFPSLPPSISRVAFYAVYDGHSGSRASKHAARTLHQHIVNKFPKSEPANRDKEIKKCLIDTFKATDEEFLKQASANKPVWKDGSTAVCVLVVDNTLYIANLGDSKALLCRCNSETKKNQFIPLSKDHNPTQYEERIRIQKAGGYIRDGRVQGIMEVSRSIGDGRFKHCGVTCLPDIKKCQLGENDCYLMLSCDGLWQGFDQESAVQFIDKILDEEEVKQVEGKTREDVLFETACNRLASESIRRGSSDNVTVIMVNIKKS